VHLRTHGCRHTSALGIANTSRESKGYFQVRDPTKQKEFTMSKFRSAPKQS